MFDKLENDATVLAGKGFGQESSKEELKKAFQARQHRLELWAKSQPLDLFKAWLQDAQTHEPMNPTAMTLATVDSEGRPNARMVLLKDWQQDWVFYTNGQSVKADEIRHTSSAAVCFYWKSTGRQVRARGSVREIPRQQTQAYFATRPRLTQLGARASQQSRPIEDVKTFSSQFFKEEENFRGQDIPCPNHWTGFAITPVEIEFWQEGTFRLHERLVFRREDVASVWTSSILFP